MLIALLGLLAVVSVPIVGGRLSKLLDLHLRFTWLLLLGLFIQIVIISVLPGDGDGALHRGLHLLTYAFGFVWLAANPSFPWRWILTIGGALNFLVIAVNGGVMPATQEALRSAGEGAVGGFTNSVTVEGARLGFLGDIFTVPSWVPFGNVFSIGDVLIVVGGFLMVHAACDSAIGRLLVPIQDPPMLRWRPPEFFHLEIDTPGTASTPPKMLRWRADGKDAPAPAPTPVPSASWTPPIDSGAPSTPSTPPTPTTPGELSPVAWSAPRSSLTPSS
jgi:hypothetical protein